MIRDEFARDRRPRRASFRVINEARQAASQPASQAYRIVPLRETGNALLSEPFDIHRVHRRPSLGSETAKRSRQVNGILAIMQQSDADNLPPRRGRRFFSFFPLNRNRHVYLADVKRGLKVTAI